MVINSHGKSPFEIRDFAGNEFKEIYDNQGRLLFKNWDEIQGSLPLQFKSYADYLKDYRIYGNTVQNGTPTPENPVEVQGVGEYDAALNGYKITVIVSNGTNSVTTPVYIGSEPLHKIGDYADYVDFERSVVVRRIKKLVLTGEENWGLATNGRICRISLNGYLKELGTVITLSTHYSGSSTVDSVSLSTVPDLTCTCIVSDSGSSYFYVRDDSLMSTGTTSERIAAFKSFLSTQYSGGTPVTVWYVLAEPEDESLENLLPIQIIKGSDVLTVDTTVRPSKMYIKGKIKSL